jgi:hypothetical protein
MAGQSASFSIDRAERGPAWVSRPSADLSDIIPMSRCQLPESRWELGHSCLFDGSVLLRIQSGCNLGWCLFGMGAAWDQAAWGVSAGGLRVWQVLAKVLGSLDW